MLKQTSKHNKSCQLSAWSFNAIGSFITAGRLTSKKKKHILALTLGAVLSWGQNCLLPIHTGHLKRPR